MFQWWLAATKNLFVSVDIKRDLIIQVGLDVVVSRLDIDWCPYQILEVRQYRNIGGKSQYRTSRIKAILTTYSKLASACRVSWLCVCLGFSVSLHAAVYVSLRVLHGVGASQETGNYCSFLFTLTIASSLLSPIGPSNFHLISFSSAVGWFFHVSSILSSLSTSRPSWRQRSRTCHGKWSEPTATREEWWEARGSSAPATEGWDWLLLAFIHS